MATTNRPLKYGTGSRREPISSDGEVSIRLINDANANPIYIGRARPGAPETEPLWQLCKLAYDANNGLISLKWPENDLGVASTEYEFVFSSGTSVSVSSITNANPGVVTTGSAHGFTDGDLVTFSGAIGMTEVNFDNTTDTVYMVASASPTTFELNTIDGDNVNTSAYGVYAGSGVVEKQSWANYVYE